MFRGRIKKGMARKLKFLIKTLSPSALSVEYVTPKAIIRNKKISILPDGVTLDKLRVFHSFFNHKSENTVRGIRLNA